MLISLFVYVLSKLNVYFKRYVSNGCVAYHPDAELFFANRSGNIAVTIVPFST
jgi:hypothetical protein